MHMWRLCIVGVSLNTGRVCVCSDWRCSYIESICECIYKEPGVGLGVLWSWYLGMG